MKINTDQIEAVKEFNNKITQNAYKIEHVTCLCNSKNSRNISNNDRYGLWNPVVICRDCGLIYANPRLTLESYNLFYSTDEYRRIYEAGEINYIERAKQRFNNGYGRHIFNEIDPIVKDKKDIRVMEFGCAAGWNLSHFTNEGYHVTGYDYSPSLIALGRSRGLNLFVGSFKEITGEYDVIILSHVIEHFTSLFQDIREIITHLKKGGIVYIEVPDMDKYGKGQLQNAHVYYFTKRTLSYYITLLGLREVKSGTAQEIHMYGIYEIDRYAKPSNIGLKWEYLIMMRKVILDKFKSIIRNVYYSISPRS